METKKDENPGGYLSVLLNVWAKAEKSTAFLVMTGMLTFCLMCWLISLVANDTSLDGRLQAAGVPAQKDIFGACGDMSVTGPYEADLSGVKTILILRSDSVSHNSITMLKLREGSKLGVYRNGGFAVVMNYIGSYRVIEKNYDDEVNTVSKSNRKESQYHFFSSEDGLVALREQALFKQVLGIEKLFIRDVMLVRADFANKSHYTYALNSECGDIVVGDNE